VALEQYKRKRDFSKTPEPVGEVAAAPGDLSFVVQKHDASRLHYDFRLEMDGVLKSWAVPKGPSYDPKDRRLAVHVEDHPVSYGSFEGTIPEGEYGGGTVMLWDRGSWSPIGDPEEGYSKGDLKFILHGARLKGAWVLVRMGKRSGDKDNWLLIKEKDEFADPGHADKALKEGTVSVDSGRSIDEIAAGKPPADGKAEPRTFKPELATLSERAPEGDVWLHEIKYDGYRALGIVRDGSVKILTRNGNDWTTRFPTVAKALAKLPVGSAWLDGEIVVLDEHGVSSFQALQNALKTGQVGDMTYYAFDLLRQDGEDLAPRPLLDRKAALKGLLETAGSDILRYSEHVRGDGAEFHSLACRHGLEGIVSKRADSAYHPGRGLDWLKVKCRLVQEFVVGGYTEPEGSRSHFGALLVGTYGGDGCLVYAGKVGTGFDERTLADVASRLGKLEAGESPFCAAIPRSVQRGARWVKPQMVVEAEFANWTGDGLVRQASFQGVREDKPAREVVREAPLAVPGVKGGPKVNKKAATPLYAGIELTHPDRIVYPDIQLTKAELAAYFEAAAPWILPHLAGRPLTLVRCPEGASGKCFYQKNAGANPPEHVDLVSVTTDDGPAQYTAISRIEGLLQLVQLGVLEFHTWGATMPRLDRPDRIVFDLDPDEGLDPQKVVEAARAVRDRLSNIGLLSFVKTTGGKGLHVVVPFSRRHTWEDAKSFSKAIAESMVREAPDRYTSNLRKAERTGRVFIDYLRNAEGATAVAAYSTRARAGAPVSVPIGWEELDASLLVEPFTVRTVQTRLSSGDPWADYASTRQSITGKMRNAVGLR
jgi:bifunctional non-homologous end joining protein LigD